jgi:hypothetical protein
MSREPLVWLLYWLAVHPSPDDLVSLNTLEGHSPLNELLPIRLRPMKVQFGPYSVSLFHRAQDLYLQIWNRREKEAPVFPHPCWPSEGPLRVKRLLTAKVWGKIRHHRVQVVPIGCLYHALENRFGGRVRLHILYLFLWHGKRSFLIWNSSFLCACCRLISI